MDLSSLRDFEAKFTWAHKDFATLDEASRALGEDLRNRVVREDKPDGAGYRERIPDIPPVNPELSLVVGDAVFDLRACLDQLVYEIAANAGASEKFLGKCIFPVKDTEGRFNSVLGRINELPPGAQDAIRDLQPYQAWDKPGRREWLEPLWVLDELNNIDKHRRLNLLAGGRTLVSGWTEHLVPDDQIDDFGSRVISNGPLKDEGVFLEVTYKTAEVAAKVRHHYDFAFGITLDEPTIHWVAFDNPFMPHPLNELAQHIEGVVFPALAPYL